MALVLNEWETACNGGGKRIWFLIRKYAAPIEVRYHYNRRGDLIRYANHETAGLAADKLNRQEATQ
jgi:hypothetical protein